MKSALKAATLYDYLSISALIGGVALLGACVQSIGAL